MLNKIKFYLHALRLTKNRFFRNILNKSKTNRVQTEYSYKSYGVPNKHTFFGYFDVSPFSKDKKMLASCVESSKGKMDLGYFDLKDQKNIFNKIAETNAWCWQMGARLQWYGLNGDKIIFNDSDGEIPCSKIVSLSQKEVLKQFNFPFYSINKNCTYSLSINFSRLEKHRPGYGYVFSGDESPYSLAPKNDGIFLGNLKTGGRKLILSFSDLSKEKSEKSMIGASHYVNHLYFYPDNSRLLFFHCWNKKGRKKVRLLSSDFNGNSLDVITTSRQILSHLCWVDSKTILAYLVNGDEGRGYYFIDLKTNQLKKYKGYLFDNLDGHPYSSSDFFVTDTVPDEYSERNLIINSFKNNSSNLISRIYSNPLLVGPERCDLHPRLNENFNLVSVDSAHKGYREMLVFDLNKKLVS